MIDIKIDNAHSQVVADEKVINKLSRVLSYEMAGAFFARQANPYCDGRIYLMDKKGIFPTGLLAILVKFLKQQSLAYRFVDVRSIPKNKIAYKLNLPFSPRDYQVAAVETGRSRGVLVIGTGGGKTLTSAMMVAKHGVQTLVVTPDTNLRQQMYDSYAEWFEEKHLSTSVDSDASIVIANIQSLANKPPSMFHRFNMLVIDEFHHCLAKNTMISAGYGAYRSIEWIYNRVVSGFQTKVKSWNGTEWENRLVTNAFKYKSSDLLKVKIQDEDGKIKELLITRKHKMLTEHGKVEIGSMKVGDEVVLGYSTHAAAMRKRSLNTEYREYLSRRAGDQNRNRSLEVRKRQSKKIKKLIDDGSYNPYGRGKYGNGGRTTPTQDRISKMLPESISELSVALRDKERPHHYKIDVAIPRHMIAIEVDGSSHKGREESDRRKSERLRRLGWKIVRIPENCSKDGLSRLKKFVEILTSTT